MSEQVKEVRTETGKLDLSEIRRPRIIDHTPEEKDLDKMVE